MQVELVDLFSQNLALRYGSINLIFISILLCTCLRSSFKLLIIREKYHHPVIAAHLIWQFVPEFQAYFPPISQSEGLPLQFKDVKGNDWTFQFRFWPNNNSRMYVLEGVTPCIQAMQLNAGDIGIHPSWKCYLNYLSFILIVIHRQIVIEF